MSELIFALMLWLDDATPYDVGITQPKVVLLTNWELCEHYGVTSITLCDRMKLKGFYDRDGTIYMLKGFNPDNEYDQSRLLHELVHYVQWENGQQARCIGALWKSKRIACKINGASRMT